MGSLTYRIRLNRRLRSMRQQAYRPEPLTRLEWAILVASAAVAAATIWAAFVLLFVR